MKTTKTLAAGLLACALGSAAFATPTVIHITGSTAFRKSTIFAIERLMGGDPNTNTESTFEAAYVASSASTGGEQSAAEAIFSGTISSQAVIIKCDWTGSVGGLQTVTQNIVPPSGGWLANSVLPSTNIVQYAGSTAALDTPVTADITMSDNHASSVGVNTSNLTENQVGVIVFEWVINNGAPSTITNITSLQAQALLAGITPLSTLSGNASDDAQPVYLVGRNFDSGTRVSELAETGYGVFNTVSQLQPVISGTAGTLGSITALNLYQAETIDGISFPLGGSGYSSGGTLAGVLATPGSNSTTVSSAVGTTGTQTAGWLVGYLGRSDAVTACSHTTGGTGVNTAHRLTFNGVADWGVGTSTLSGGEGSITGANTVGGDDNDVINGRYQGWEFEWLDYRNSLSGVTLTVAQAMISDIQTTDGSASGILLSSMNVTKPVEGAVIVP